MLRRWLLIAAVTVVAFIGSAVAWSVLQQRPPMVGLEQPGPLVVVSVPTLLYADTPDTRGSALWGLARTGAVGALATRTLSGHSCSLQSWLSLSAGARASVGPTVGETPSGQAPGRCPPPPPLTVNGRAATVPGWMQLRRSALALAQPADIGRLGTLLQQDGQCISAAGAFAALGAADADGVIADYVADPYQVALGACPVTFISLAGPDDTYLKWLTSRLPARATIVVAGLADDDGPETLHAVVIAGPGVRHGLLSSTSIRHRGVIGVTDLSAFVLSRLSSGAPHLTEGRPPLVQPSGSATAAVVRSSELAKALTIEHAFVPLFFPAFFVLTIVGWVIGALAWLVAARRSPTGRARQWARGWLVMVSAFAAAMPASTFVVNVLPWWRAEQPRLQLTLGIVGLSFLFGVVALWGPWRRIVGGPAAFLCLLTAAVISLDVSHGSDLQFLSMLGLQPVYGGRYSGMGNVAFGLFATASLTLAVIVSDPLTRGEGAARRLAPLTVLLIGTFAVLIDGYPRWGADGGGPAALIPAFAYLVIGAAAMRLTVLRTLWVGVVAVLTVGLLAVLDYLRGPTLRTHLGNFVAQLADGRSLESLNRIWQGNWNMLTSSALTLCVPFLLLFLVVIAMRPSSRAALVVRPITRGIPLFVVGLRAVAVVWLLGFLLNDSGTAIPPAGAMLLVPVLVLLAVQLSPSAPSAPAVVGVVQPVGHVDVPR